MKKLVVYLVLAVTLFCTACANKVQSTNGKEVDSDVIFEQKTYAEDKSKVDIFDENEKENIIENESEIMTQMSSVAEIVEEKNDGYAGHYVDTQETSEVYSELQLIKQDEKTYVTQIGIYRLTTLDGFTVLENGKLIFTDEIMGITGTIDIVKGVSARFTVTKSDWDLILEGDVFEFPTTIDKINVETVYDEEEMKGIIQYIFTEHVKFYIPFACGNMSLEEGHEGNQIPVDSSNYDGDYATYVEFLRSIYSPEMTDIILQDPRYFEKEGVLYADTDCYGEKGTIVEWPDEYRIDITSATETECYFIAYGSEFGKANSVPVEGMLVKEPNGWRMNTLEYE